MTDDLERLEALARAARSANKQLGYDALARACTAATILSLIQRVREAEATALQEQKDSSELMLIAHMDGADMGRKAGRAEALEEATKVADDREKKWAKAQAGRYAEGKDGRREGAHAIEAQRIAAAIRALGEKDHGRQV